MTGALSIQVRLHDDRYHGSDAWPPTPARLYQALVAGSACGGVIEDPAARWLRWFEQLSPPLVGAPLSKLGKGYVSYVPNNDLDAEGGDPANVANIRAGKFVRPRLLAAARPLAFLWPLNEEQRASMPCEPHIVVDRLYQFGRGVDGAWATARVLDEAQLSEYRQRFEGVFYEPAAGSGGAALDCPHPGSLASLEAQFAGKRSQFAFSGKGRKAKQLFSRAPKPSFTRVSYDAPPARQVFELRRYEGASSASAFSPRRLGDVSRVVTSLRDLALERLTKALPEARAPWVEHALRGRDKLDMPGSRCRLIPLPSVGHTHADRQVRRVLVEVPGDCLIPAGDIFWAFSGLGLSEAVDESTGEIISETRLIAASDDAMLRHFGADARFGEAKRWRTVTAAVLPESARRRRIEPSRRREEAKGGSELFDEQRRAVAAVHAAVRHAGLGGRIAQVHVQRQPFDRQGEMAERFAVGTRFPKERLWHVEIEFREGVRGPVAIGDGRFLGLGVMVPMKPTAPPKGIIVLQVDDSAGDLSRPEDVARALRRAVMARVQKVLGPGAELHPYFHGHAADGAPLKNGHAHLGFQVDPKRKRVVVLAPHLLVHRKASEDEKKLWGEVVRVVPTMTTLVAGSAGAYRLAPAMIDAATDPLLRPSREWVSCADYTPTRYGKSGDPAADLLADLRVELARGVLPDAELSVLSVREGRRGRLRARFKLRFRQPGRRPDRTWKDQTSRRRALRSCRRYFGSRLTPAVSRARHAGCVMKDPLQKPSASPDNRSDRPRVLKRALGEAPALVPARMVNEVLYCERLMYLEWARGEYTDNHFTADGTHVHRNADVPGGKLPAPAAPSPAPGAASLAPPPPQDKEPEVQAQPAGRTYQARSLWLSSESLRLTAKIDVVESKDGRTVVPIEYKRGRGPKIPEGAYLPERAQVCAQALLLREHDYVCEEGAIYFAAARRRVPVELSEELVAQTMDAIERARLLVQLPEAPPPLDDSPKCSGCSLSGICLPDELQLLSKMGEAGAAVERRPAAGDESVPKVRRLYPSRDDRVPIYVSDPRTKLRISAQELILDGPEGVTKARLTNTSHVVVLGNAQITTQATRALINQGIDVSLLSSGGWFLGRVSGTASNNIDLRIMQHRCADDEAFCLAQAQAFVTGKIKNCRTLLRRNGRADPVVFSQLSQLARKVDKADSIESLLGLEGTAARTYFSAFGTMLKGLSAKADFDFQSRNRRPPKDPINALLSFAYSMLARDATQAVAVVGMEPLLGFYHQPRFGRPALALDLMEEFRPLIADSVVITAINTGIVSGTDFIRVAGSCNLSPAARRRVIAAYERRMDQETRHPWFGYSISYRRILEVQARLLSRVILGELEAYPAFTTR